MSKPFFYRLDPATFLAEVYKIPSGKHKAWLAQFALDLVSGEGSTEYANSMIQEAKGYIERKKEAGKKGGLAKASSARQC